MAPLSFLFLSSLSLAAPQPIHVVPHQISPPITAGSLNGGQSGDVFTLTKVTRMAAPNGVEKWSIFYGDREGRPLAVGPGFFNVAVDRGSRRVVIDLAQVNRTLLQQAGLDKIVKGSKIVETSEMVMDPADHSTNITFTMRTPVKLQAVSEVAGGSQLVLLMTPTSPVPGSPR